MAEADRFSYPLQLSLPLNYSVFVVWTFSSSYPEGVRCFPSSLYTFPLLGLARDCHLKGFPEFEKFYSKGFPLGTQFHKSVVYTSSTTAPYYKVR